MGCWQESDAITTHPIFAGDEVVMIFLTHSGLKNNIMLRDAYSLKYSVGFIKKGVYDDYGWLEDLDDPDDTDEKYTHPQCHTIFVARHVWDTIVKTEVRANDPKGIEFMNELATVLDFACRCRIDLKGPLATKGLQYWGGDDVDKYELLSDLRAWGKQRLHDHEKEMEEF